MAYDLEEQEQLEQIKAFWTKWGNIITWAATAVALIFAAYYGYKYYQRSQSLEAAPMFEQLEKAAATAQTDPKNVQLVSDLASTLTTKYGKTAYAQMGALMAAKVQLEQNKTDAAISLLKWTIEHAKDEEYQHIARSRLASLYIDTQKPAEALALLPEQAPKGYEVLFANRRGDALSVSGKKDLAIVEYQKAWSNAAEASSIKELLEQKLTLLGADTPAKVTP